MYLGLDLGTSSFKAVLMRDDQTIVASAAADLSVTRPHPGWSEQQPDHWAAALNRIVDRLATERARDMAAVRGIGLSGHMHGATLLDAADRPLRPCILWNDGRSGAEATRLDEAAQRICGNLAMPGFTAPKLLWVRDHEPDVFAKVRTVLLPKDYVRLLLTGDKASEMSDSAGTLWLDMAARAWSDEMLALTDLTRDHMPKLFEGTEVTGTLRPDLARRWGMSTDVVVAGGGGDNAASACGVGAVAPGTGFVSIGTSGVIFVTADSYAPNTAGAVHTFCHAIPGTWHQMGVALSAAGSLEWLSRVTDRSAEELSGALPESPRGPSDLRFLPYLSGERTPHNDVAIRGAFVGLDQGHGLADLTQAVMEGVAFSFRDCMDVLTAPLAEPKRLIAVGGGSRSAFWLKTIATVLDTPIAVPVDGDFGAALGAARLGLIAAENADPFAVCTPPEIRETIDPDQHLAASYAAAYAHYRKLYPALREVTPQ